MKKLTAIAAIIISALIASASMVQPGLLDSQAAGTPDTFVISVTPEDLKPVEIDRTEQTAGRLTEYASDANMCGELPALRISTVRDLRATCSVRRASICPAHRECSGAKAIKWIKTGFVRAI